MPSHADAILQDLHRVTEERRRRREDPALGERVRSLKAFQQARFSHTYEDLLHHPRYEAASRFFLVELYGPSDFSRRDEQFARVVPAMVRLFPDDIVATVATLAALHALSERMDTEMAAQLVRSDKLDAMAYIGAWQATGQPTARERQIALTVQVGERLDRLTRNPLLRHSLRMMRGPARAAGLTELQHFIETGFDTFRAMRGAKEFLALIGDRERHLAESLFGARSPFDAAALSDWLPGVPD
jgi:hypothetical protein